MIFELIFIIFFQPLLSSIFLFLAPIVNDYFKSSPKINFKIILYTFISDLIFIKPIGFFLFLTSLSLLLISLLEKFINPEKFYQQIIFLFIFNLIFFFIFNFLIFNKINFLIFDKIFLVNFIFQVAYLKIRSIF